MKKKTKSQHRSHTRRPSERTQVEQMLGRKLLRGEIPVVPPSRLALPRCPIPSGVEGFDEVCKDYTEGRISYEDVLTKVGDSMKKPMGDYPKVENANEVENVKTD